MKQTLLLGAITLLLLVSGVLGCIFVTGRKDGKTAVIYHNGQEVQRIDLAAITEPYTIALHGENGAENVILAEHGAISMQSASCPDGLCVQRGRITGSGLPIVCLPNHVIIEIEGGADDESEIDIWAY